MFSPPCWGFSVGFARDSPGHNVSVYYLDITSIANDLFFLIAVFRMKVGFVVDAALDDFYHRRYLPNAY
jgi:hypothetical protein